jgi:hypothetical protein
MTRANRQESTCRWHGLVDTIIAPTDDCLVSLDAANMINPLSTPSTADSCERGRRGWWLYLIGSVSNRRSPAHDRTVTIAALVCPTRSASMLVESRAFGKLVRAVEPTHGFLRPALHVGSSDFRAQGAGGCNMKETSAPRRSAIKTGSGTEEPLKYTSDRDACFQNQGRLASDLGQRERIFLVGTSWPPRWTRSATRSIASSIESKTT